MKAYELKSTEKKKLFVLMYILRIFFFRKSFLRRKKEISQKEKIILSLLKEQN